MHDALKVPELVSEIFSHYASFSKRDKPTLARLARTCRRFSGPALDRLWERQETLHNLLACLPSDCWELRGDPSPREPTLVLLRDVSQNEWACLAKHRNRVRTLDLSSNNYSRGHPTLAVIRALSIAFPSHFLPNLRRLVWGVHVWPPWQDNLFRYVGIFIHPDLIDVNLRLPGAEFGQLAANFLQPVTGLRRLILSIGDHFDANDIEPALTALVPYLQELRSASLPTLSGAMIHNLSQLPLLKHLSVESADSKVTAATFAAPSSNLLLELAPFRSLATLKLPVTVVHVAKAVVGAQRRWDLTKLELGFHSPVSRNTIAELYALVASHCNPMKLNHLYIGEADRDVMLDPPQNAQPQYASARRRVSLIDDAHLWHLARSWPRITQLTLQTGSESEVQLPPTTTLDALRAFATHCPELVSLGLALDATVVPPFETYRDARIMQSALRSISVGKSAIRDPADVARFLSSFFTATLGITTRLSWRWADDREAEDEEERVEKENHDRWMKVKELLPLLVTVRREEREPVA
ncbi:hypothetical protein MKEN_00196700 [Mycena kentingensis (nom. inval.)]|nr:hypothetical protein MKEN_00196700 [Mycena kentingensis (nom. inval.)]